MRSTTLIGLILSLMLTADASAQCVWKVLPTTQDQETGAAIANVEYTIQVPGTESAEGFAEKIGGVALPDNSVVKVGRTRYNETSGTNQQILDKFEADRNEHCNALLQRIPENEEFIREKITEKNTQLALPVVDLLRGEEGKTGQVAESVVIWKGTSIKVTNDQKNSVSNITF